MRDWIILFIFISSLMAQDVMPVEQEKISPPIITPAKIDAPVITDDGTRVAILGYHDFSNTLKETAMRIKTDKFRTQMQALKDLGLNVIPMSEFIAWKETGKAIPPRSVVITIDDGWKSVYTDAFPILKEFGYPFTVYLYKAYVNVQGKSMSFEMIQEMKKNGCDIGSHSVTHPYPQAVKNKRSQGEKIYDEYLQTELGDAKNFLEENFKKEVNTYAYPGGFYTDEMFAKAKQVGYTHLFTVIPGKVKRTTNNLLIPRYIILGNYDSIFQLATEFHDTKSNGALAAAQKTAYPVVPEPGAIINTRLPNISADLSTLSDFVADSISMKVAGFGEVPATFDPNTKRLVWQVNRRLRTDTCEVTVSWKVLSSNKITTAPLRWTFNIDKAAAYQPSENE